VVTFKAEGGVILSTILAQVGSGDDGATTAEATASFVF